MECDELIDELIDGLLESPKAIANAPTPPVPERAAAAANVAKPQSDSDSLTDYSQTSAKKEAEVVRGCRWGSVEAILG